MLNFTHTIHNMLNFTHTIHNILNFTHTIHRAIPRENIQFFLKMQPEVSEFADFCTTQRL